MSLAIASLLAGVLLLLAAPIHVHLSLERDEALRSRVRIRGLFGLVRLRVHPRRERARPVAGEARRRKRRRRARASRRVATALLEPAVRARAVGFLRDVMRALRPRDLRVRARIGLDDPADTGRLWAVLGPLGALQRCADVVLEPDFSAACLRFRAGARVRLIPLQLLALTAGFVLSPSVLRALLAR